jgi:2-oxoglutarate ferredoxin oxidoreductase subunit alpha
MSHDQTVLTGEHFINGDTACAEGALAAGCRFFAGYPITPATEIAERMASRLPEIGGTYIQMEDEIASMNAILGASWAGAKSMTATSGPGFSLMMENIGLGMMTETPCVVVDVQRGGPSTGLPTLVGQSDVMQARWGSHGDYSVIALAPSSAQEMFDLTIQAFNFSERFRLPVFVLSDEVVGHLTEKVTIPPREHIQVVNRKKYSGATDAYLPYHADDDLVPPMVAAGEGFRVHITGLTHDERGYPAINADTQKRLVRRLVDKVKTNADKIIMTEEINVEEAEVVIVCYGITARISHRVRELAKRAGLRVGLLRLMTIWPFPEARIRELAGRIEAFVVPEINCGQIVYEVERAAAGQAAAIPVSHAGGSVHDPEEILWACRQAVGKKGML